jgi:hypothetical protein
VASRPRPSTEEVSAPRLVAAARCPEIPQLAAVCQAVSGESQMPDHALRVPRAVPAIGRPLDGAEEERGVLTSYRIDIARQHRDRATARTLQNALTARDRQHAAGGPRRTSRAAHRRSRPERR